MADPLAQSVEHHTFNVGVLGSNPKRVTFIKMQREVASFLFSLYLPPSSTTPYDFVTRKKPPPPCDFAARIPPPSLAISSQRSHHPLRFRRKEATVHCDFVARKKQKMQAPNVKTQKNAANLTTYCVSRIYLLT